MMKFKKIFFGILLWFLPILSLAQEAPKTFVIQKDGVVVGFLDYTSQGGTTFQDTQRDWQGMVFFQEKEDSNMYSSEFSKQKQEIKFSAKMNGKALRVEKILGTQSQTRTFASDLFPLFFSEMSPASLLALQDKFPKQEGDVLVFPVFDLSSMDLLEGMIENEGERVFSYNGTTIKAEYFVAQIGKNGVVLYEDNDGKIFLMQMPLEKTEWHLQDYDPVSFPITQKDILSIQKPTNFSRQEAVLHGAGHISLKGEFWVPTGHGPFSAALLLAGSGNVDRNGNLVDDPIFKPKLLKDLADFLVAQGIAVLHYDKPSHENPANLAEDAFHACLWLRGQKNVDPNRVFIVGIGEGGEVGVREAQKDSELAGLVLLSPTPFVFRDSSAVQTLQKLNLPVLILEGGNPDTRLLQVVENLKAQIAGDSSLITLHEFPGLDSNLMKPTHLQGPAAYFDPERRISPQALDFLSSWLINHGL
jgi:dienelactone hydrolase